jgi:threonine dehydrogenase-like Zn-dependent dehydrogenase
MQRWNPLQEMSQIMEDMQSAVAKVQASNEATLQQMARKERLSRPVPETMRAVVFIEPYKLEYWPKAPTPFLEEKTDVIVKVRLAAICGSDLHPYRGTEGPLDAGTVMGHEFVGEIVSCGTDVTELAVGDAVYSPFTTNCGTCFYCSEGLTCRCTKGQLFGWRQGGVGLHGGQAEYVRVPLAEATLVKKPDSLSDAEVLLLGDNLSTGYFCAMQARIKPHEVVLVIGLGPVGLLAVASALHFLDGTGAVVAVDTVEERLEIAKQLGAQPMSAADSEAVVSAVRALTDGRGADRVLEAVGSATTMRLAVDAVRPAGTISSVGVHAYERLPFSPIELYDKNLTISAGRCPARHIISKSGGSGDGAAAGKTGPEAVLARFPQLASQLMTHRLALSEAVSAYEWSDKKQKNCVKILLDMAL